MNQVIQQIKSRKSVRAFEDRAISSDIKGEILEAAFQAPTAGCQMLYTIIDVTDQEIKERLADLCDHQPFIAQAPMVLVFLADTQRWYDSFAYAGCNPRRPEAGDLLLACSDATIAAQNTVVAAESFGIGSCYIGDILENCEEVRDLLNLPDYVVPTTMLVYGYPTDQQKSRRKPIRFDSSYIVHENGYRTLSKEEHFDMHQDYMTNNNQDHKSVTEKLEAFCKRKYMSDFSKEMSRSVRKYLESFKTSQKVEGKTNEK